MISGHMYIVGDDDNTTKFLGTEKKLTWILTAFPLSCPLAKLAMDSTGPPFDMISH